MAVRPSGCSEISWRKSRASVRDGECVEIARLDASVLVRDSRDKNHQPLKLSITQWRWLMTRIRSGDLDPS